MICIPDLESMSSDVQVAWQYIVTSFRLFLWLLPLPGGLHRCGAVQSLLQLLAELQLEQHVVLPLLHPLPPGPLLRGGSAIFDPPPLAFAVE